MRSILQPNRHTPTTFMTYMTSKHILDIASNNAVSSGLKCRDSQMVCLTITRKQSPRTLTIADQIDESDFATINDTSEEGHSKMLEPPKSHHCQQIAPSIYHLANSYSLKLRPYK